MQIWEEIFFQLQTVALTIIVWVAFNYLWRGNRRPLGKKCKMAAGHSGDTKLKKADACNSDISTEDLSDHSNKSDGGTTDAKESWRDLPIAPPPGLGPPGLESSWSMPLIAREGCGQQPEPQLFEDSSGSRLSALAPVFVPGGVNAECGDASWDASDDSKHQNYPRDMRETIRVLRGALEDWEASLQTSDCGQSDLTFLQKDRGLAALQRGHLQNWDLAALEEAMGKLSPHEAQALRTVLESKAEPHRVANQERKLPKGMWSHAAQDGAHVVADHLASAHAAVSSPLGAPKWAGCRSSDTHGLQKSGVRMRPSGNTRFGTHSRAKTADCAKDAAPEDPPGESLRSFLCDLSSLENARVILVRKIKYLGMDPTKALETYFSRFGCVERVMVTPTRTSKSSGDMRPGNKRVRASNVGFVLMGDIEAVEAALKHGEEHAVDGGCINVYKFESHSIDGTD